MTPAVPTGPVPVPEKAASPDEEVLIPDARANMTPAEAVEQNLVAILESCPVLVSNLQHDVRRRPQ
jgi:hypothetical protein